MKRFLIIFCIFKQLSYANMEQPIQKEWDAERYAQNSKIQFSKALEVLNTWPFAGNEVVLDLGCGNGLITTTIAKKLINGIIYGTDISENMIAYAKKHNSRSNLIFQVHNAEKLPFINQFDLVFSFNCIHWIKNKQAVFDSVYKSLKSKGQFIFFFVAQPENETYLLFSIADQLKNSKKWEKYFINHEWPWSLETSNIIFNMLEKAGFTVKNLEIKQKIANFENRQGLIKHFLALPWLSHLSETKQKEFIEEFIDIYLFEQSSTNNLAYFFQTHHIYGIVEKP